ncbi:hypothetical protein [Microbacterium sp.]|uniref:hypothetical protein n=1 Tax=Microbacterium sp. TaxID=51671 RepID=UPI003F9910B8
MNAASLGTLPLTATLPAADYAALVDIGEAEGASGASLAAEIIHEYLEARREGKVRQKRSQRLSDVELGEIVERWQAGATPEGLAFVYGVTPDTIIRRIRRLTGSARRGGAHGEA